MHEKEIAVTMQQLPDDFKREVLDYDKIIAYNSLEQNRRADSWSSESSRGYA